MDIGYCIGVVSAHTKLDALDRNWWASTLIGATDGEFLGLICVIKEEQHAYRVQGHDLRTAFQGALARAPASPLFAGKRIHHPLNMFLPCGGNQYVLATNIDGSWSKLRLRAPALLRKYHSSFWDISPHRP